MFDFNVFIASLGYTPTKIFPTYTYFNGKEHEFADEKVFTFCFFRMKGLTKKFDHTIKVSINGCLMENFNINDTVYKDFPAWLSTWCYAPVVPLDYEQYGMLDISTEKIKKIKFDQDVDCILINCTEIKSVNPEMTNRWRHFT